MRVSFNSHSVKIKHQRTTIEGKVTGLVEGFEGTWEEGYQYHIVGDDVDCWAELIDVTDEGKKNRLTFDVEI